MKHENLANESRIVDMEAYMEWKEEATKPDFINKAYTLPDCTVISGRSSLKDILAVISEYDEDEQEAAKQWYKTYRKAYRRVKLLYEKAYGVSMGEKSIVNSGKIINKSYDLITQDSEKKELVIKLFGSLYSVEEVHGLLKTRYNMNIATSELKKFRGEFNNEIERAKDRFRDEGTIKETRLFFKRARVEEINELYSDAKLLYEESKDRNDLRCLMDLLSAMRKEVEGEKSTVNNILNLNMDQKIESHLKSSDALKNLPIQELIISRLSQKTGVSSSVLLDSINKSKYSVSIDSNTAPEYPSDSNYNFDQLAYMIEDRDKNQETKSEVIIENKPVISGIKERLLAAIKNKQIDL